MNFKDIRKIVINTYGKGVDGDPDDDPCFYCEEECGGEPIYKEDFPQIDVRNGFALCPVCEEEFG